MELYSGIILIFVALGLAAALLLTLGKLFGEMRNKEINVGREGYAMVLVSLIFGFALCGGILIEHATGLGSPKTSIEVGSYTVVSVVEVSKDKQAYYQMVLEQNGKVKLHTLPKDMISVVESTEKPHTLEVVNKAGLTKATLYNNPLSYSVE